MGVCKGDESLELGKEIVSTGIGVEQCEGENVPVDVRCRFRFDAVG